MERYCSQKKFFESWNRNIFQPALPKLSALWHKGPHPSRDSAEALWTVKVMEREVIIGFYINATKGVVLNLLFGSKTRDLGVFRPLWAVLWRRQDREKKLKRIFSNKKRKSSKKWTFLVLRNTDTLYIQSYRILFAVVLIRLSVL